MIYTAKKARNNTIANIDKNLNLKIQEIFKQIKEQADLGFFEAYTKEELTKGEIQFLADLGYHISENKFIDIDNSSMVIREYIITW